MEELIKQVIDFKDWQDVPEYYQWRAIDPSGRLSYFDVEPQRWLGNDPEWVNGSETKFLAFYGGKLPFTCEDWKKMVQQRPKNDHPNP